MDTIADQIKELQAKKEKGLTLLTRYKTQLEGLVASRDELLLKLKEEHGVSFEEAERKLDELKGKRDQLLEEAKKALEKITL